MFLKFLAVPCLEVCTSIFHLSSFCNGLVMRSDCVIQQSTIVVYMGISHFLSIAEGNFRFVFTGTCRISLDALAIYILWQCSRDFLVCSVTDLAKEILLKQHILSAGWLLCAPSICDYCKLCCVLC